MTAPIVLLLLAIPLGFYLAYKTRDELIEGRNWFASLVVIAAILAIVFALKGEYSITFTSIFIGMVSFISYLKSFDMKWTKRRI